MKMALEPGHPLEIHVISFPDESALRTYQEDPETRKLALLRNEIISTGSIVTGRSALGPLRIRASP